MPSRTAFDELNALDGPALFATTDRLVRAEMRHVVSRFGRLRSECSRDDDADRLMRLVWACYADLWQGYAECLSEARGRAYAAVWPSHGQVAKGGAFERWASSYALPEAYQPRGEWERKRARAFEAMVAARDGGRAPSTTVTRSRDVWARQLRQGADDMTDLGVADAYADAGVTRVRFHTQEDDRVCSSCRPLDGRTYAIADAPALPLHWNCRCWLEPVA